MSQIIFILIIYFTNDPTSITTSRAADVQECHDYSEEAARQIENYNASHPDTAIKQATAICLDATEGKTVHYAF